MPVFMCPNCNASMQTVNRSGVEFDMCPTCRGVWLDRGEMEKMLAAGREEIAAQQGGYPRESRGGGDFLPRDHRHEDQRREYRDDDRHHYKHKKKSSIFDIFD